VSPAPCEVCAGTTHRPLFVRDGYEFLRCSGCGHVFLDLALGDADLARLYATAFFRGGAYSDYVRDKAVMQRNFRRFVAVLRGYGNGGRLFEIGAAYGFFLELARRHWRVEGVDIVGEAAAYARTALGLDVAAGDFLELPLVEAAYDVVAMWDTIEHLRHPARYVAKIGRILKPGGIVALTTGDVGSVMARVRGRRWRLYHPPFHIHYFSRQTIADLLSRHGLAVVSIKAVGFDRSLDTMLYRVLADGKPAVLRAAYRGMRGLGFTRRALYLNLFDIMLVVARRV
jgi:SAM-dependent methyltransferase